MSIFLWHFLLNEFHPPWDDTAFTGYRFVMVYNLYGALTIQMNFVIDVI